MPDRVPISFLLDDPAPIVHVYQAHFDLTGKTLPVTGYFEPLTPTIPNSFLDRFCDVMEARDIKGKFSIVPSPCGQGDIVSGIPGRPREELASWLDTVKRRLGSRCDFCPEMITHGLAVNLDTGGTFPENESEWSQNQSRETLTRYVTRALELMQQAGFDCTGVTSPWEFGGHVEADYVAAIAAAQRAVYGRDQSWYFLHAAFLQDAKIPWIAYQEDASTVVSIPATMDDGWWETINNARTDDAFVSSIADKFLSADGRDGWIIQVLEAGAWPILVTHWQSLYSNGLETGLKALDLVGQRIQGHLLDRVEWLTCSEMMERVIGTAGR